jgi:hypothetical protein
MEASIVLEVSKKALDLAHLAGGSVIKNDAGEKYLILQGATGNTDLSTLYHTKKNKSLSSLFFS